MANAAHLDLVLRSFQEFRELELSPTKIGPFFIAVPRLWNELPVSFREAANIDAFKRQLKTYLFKKAYLLKLFYLISKPH